MRIAVLNQREGGGATAQARDLLSQAAAHGWETSYLPSEEVAGTPEDLLRRLQAFAPDVVHAHCFYNSWPPGVLKRIATVWPVAFTLHDVYAVNQWGTECWECSHNPYCWACPALPVPKRWYSVYRVRSRREREAAWRGLRAHVIHPTEWMLRRTSRTAIAALPSSVIPYGIDTGAFAPDARARADLGLGEAPVVLSVGSMYSPLDDRKGFAVLVDAFRTIVRREVPAARLVIVGRLFGIESSDGITVEPAVDREKLRKWYAASDVFALPSLGDNAPLAVLEAMASGIPVVATTVGGIPEEVDAGTTGLLVPPRDAEQLGRALVLLLRDRGRRAAMGAAGRTRAIERFGRDRAWAAHEALYGHLIAERPYAPRPRTSPRTSS
jgi:glycosyltransferase involved in cell wall biosynthesis